MSASEYSFTAELWQWASAKASWYFVTLPEPVSDAIADGAPAAPGFGSVRVEATIAGSTWRTSVFPSKEHGAYILPVKKAVRIAEGIGDGDVIACVVRPL